MPVVNTWSGGKSIPFVLGTGLLKALLRLPGPVWLVWRLGSAKLGGRRLYKERKAV